LGSPDECAIGILLIQADTETIQAAPQGVEQESSSGKGLTLVLTNKAPYPQRIYVERSDWYTDAVTAAQVTALQHFRDLFSDEVLRLTIRDDTTGVDGYDCLARGFEIEPEEAQAGLGA